MNAPLFDDAAPGGAGAGVNGPNTSPNLMPLTFAPTRRTAPETSQEAGRRIEGIAGALCQRVLAHIRECGAHGATDAECQTALGMLTQTQTPRRNTLAKFGAVVNSGCKRLTPSGRRAIVWVTPENAPTTPKPEGVKP